jgi:hypothetical protein
MKKLFLVLLLCVVGCATPVRVVETYTTDSTTGKTTKVIQRFYDTIDIDQIYFYQQDYYNNLFRPYAYYDPFFYDPFWGAGWPYRPSRIVIPVNPPRSPRRPRVRPGGDYVPAPGNSPRPGVSPNPGYAPRHGDKPGNGNTPKRSLPRPLPPGPRGTYVPGGGMPFSTPPAVRPVERGTSPIRTFPKPDNYHR